VNKICKQFKKEDDDLRQVTEDSREGYLSFFLKPVVGKRGGTEAEIANFIRHIEKGCYVDPHGPGKMNTAVDPEDERSAMIQYRGSSQGEAANKCIGETAEDLQR
jgi:hypothetical protein